MSGVVADEAVTQVDGDRLYVALITSSSFSWSISRSDDAFAPITSVTSSTVRCSTWFRSRESASSIVTLYTVVSSSTRCRS